MGIPQTKATIKKDHFLAAVEHLVAYRMLANGTIKVIKKEKRDAVPQMMRLQIEEAFCGNLLENIFGVPPEVVMSITKRLAADENFAKNMQEFADAVAPKRSLLVVPGVQPRPGHKLIITG